MGAYLCVKANSLNLFKDGEESAVNLVGLVAPFQLQNLLKTDIH